MTAVLNDAQKKVVMRVRAEINGGSSFRFVADSNQSGDRMSYHPMVHPSAYGKVLVSLGLFAGISGVTAAAVSTILPKISPYFTGNQIMAGIGYALWEFVRSDYTDIAGATGPEAGRPSDHVRELSFGEKVLLRLLLDECGFAFTDLGAVPGVGWALRAIVEEDGIQVWMHTLPNVYKDLHS